MTLSYIIIIVLASGILVKAAHWVIKSLIYLAQRMKISEFVIAFILAGIATSLPELFVGISSALNKTPILSLSNVLGSSIANITLILGITIILLKGLNIKIKNIRRNIIYTGLLLVYSLLLCLDGVLSRLDGAALLISFILYNLILVHQSQDQNKIITKTKKKELVKNILLLITSIALLLFSAQIIVVTANNLAIKLNIPLFIVGLFMIAIGTSLPELIFGIRAARQKHKDMILGGILGSLSANSTAVLGITALISPIIIENTSLFISSIIALLVAYLFFGIFSYSQKRISWQEGIILLFFYITFTIIQFLLK